VIRIAEEHNFEEIMNLLRQLNPDDPVINDGRDKVIFERILKEPNLRILILEESGKIISTCYLNIIPNLTRNAAPYAIIENVVTDTAFRNQGFGKKLMAFALESAWKAGCYKVMLQTGSQILYYLRLYRGRKIRIYCLESEVCEKNGIGTLF
jgi:GNAT superfamily N-acetyltransferase